jgi:hypothetical protein
MGRGVARLAPAYRPRRPTETVLYRAVRDHLETFLQHTRETYETPLPHYVEDEFRAYLRCGVFRYGFSRFRCDTCAHDLLVAYSCKRRGVCPTCAGRRMAKCAAHFVDRVVPDVPLRQYVLSLPFELRRLAAFKQDVLGALVKIFIEAVSARYRTNAKLKGAQVGAITYLQRFGGSLNLNVHLHVGFLDGVFTRDEERRVQFHPAHAPEATELQEIVRRVHKRAIAWLRRHGYVNQTALEARSNEPPEEGALDACAAVAMQRGTFAKLAAEADPAGEPASDEPAPLRFAAEHEGFNVHAGVYIAAGDDAGRERLFRYGARSAMALGRLRRLPDGRFAYRVKYARSGHAKHRVMTAIELLARIAAILPPPRFPLTRVHGVLAPRSSWRKDIVPRPREAKARKAEPKKDKSCKGKPPSANGDIPTVNHPVPESAVSGPVGLNSKREPSCPAQAPLAESAAGGASAKACPPPTPSFGALAPILLAPNILAVAHWNRLMGGMLYAASPYLPRAQLLRRSFDIDIEQCAKCGGRIRFIQSVTEPNVARAILERLGLPTEAPRPARARDPPTMTRTTTAPPERRVETSRRAE